MQVINSFEYTRHATRGPCAVVVYMTKAGNKVRSYIPLSKDHETYLKLLRARQALLRK